MDVILHLGAHRCGTTTFQKYLLRNASALADAGLVAWGPKTTRAGLFAGLVQRPAAVTPRIAETGDRSCGVIALSIDALAQAGYRELIVSDENMIGTLRANIQDAQLYPEARARLARFVAGFGENPRRIGLCVRSPDKLWASALSYCLLRGQPLPQAETLARIADQPRRWRDLVRAIAEVFPRSEICVWPFERFAGQPDQQLSILTNGLEISPGLLGRREWFNRSPGRADLRQLIAERGEVPADPATLEGEGAWMPFTADQQARLREGYGQDLDWLRGGADGLATFVETTNTGRAPSQARKIITSGFRRADRTWAPPQGGTEHDSEKIVV